MPKSSKKPSKVTANPSRGKVSSHWSVTAGKNHTSKVIVNLSRGKVPSHRSVTVGKNHVTVRYRAFGEDRVVKIPNDSIIASGRAALAKVPVVFD